MVIAHFVSFKIVMHHIANWMVLLNAFVKITTINFLMDMDRNIVHLNSTMPKGIRKLQRCCGGPQYTKTQFLCST